MSENMIMLKNYNIVNFNTECNQYLDKGYLLAFSGVSGKDSIERVFWAVFVKNKDVLANQ